MAVNWVRKLTYQTLDRLNNNLWEFEPKPSDPEVDRVARHNKVSLATVYGWYGMPIPGFDEVEYIMNALPEYEGDCIRDLGRSHQKRILHSVCVADGGLERDPLTNGTERIYPHGPYDLWAAVADVVARINGDLGLLEAACWYRIELETVDGDDWLVIVHWNDPLPGELSPVAEEPCV